jgi:glycosyltransferase involved in cell wall biosynthesis
MKFLFFLTGEIIGGNELVIRSLMARLNALGHRAVAIVSVWNESAYPRMLGEAGIEHHEIQLGRLYLTNYNWTRGTLYELPGAIATIRKVVKDLQPHWAIMSEPQLLLLCSYIIPQPRLAVYMHTTPDWMMRNPLFGRLVARCADRVVSVSQYVAQSINRTPLRRVRSAVVPNGTDLPAGRHRPASSSVRQAIVGRVSEQKRHLDLMRAIALLKARLPDNSFCLDVIGNADDVHASEVRTEIDRLEIASLVTFKGFVEDRDGIYDDIDILIAPALGEGFGMTLVEAGVRGVAVVAARSGGFPEIIRDGESGFLVEPGNAEALARALQSLIVDAGLRRRFAEAAQADVLARFTMERMAENFIGALS